MQSSWRLELAKLSATVYDRGMKNMTRLALLAAASVTACTHASAPAPVATRVSTPFAAEISAFEARDRATPPVPGGIVFVGSSTFRFWTSLATDFPGQNVINRGFGGSTLPDVNALVSRIVLPYRPHLVVLYAGDNDLAAGRTPGDVLDDYRQFVSLVRSGLPTARIAFVSIKPSPSRWALMGKMRAANQLVRDEIERDSLATYVDTFTPMLRADGRPRPELFGPDSLHMVRAGYAAWRDIIAPVIH